MHLPSLPSASLQPDGSQTSHRPAHRPTLRPGQKEVGAEEGKEEGMRKREGKKKGLPVMYVYDSYNVPVSEWAKLLHPPPGSSLSLSNLLAPSSSSHQFSLRGTQHDCIMLCLVVEKGHRRQLTDGGFDGAYTYFAAEGFTEGSRGNHWADARQRMAAHGKLFYPSVGPGYNDTLIRPWNAAATRSRDGGRYYDAMWRAALDAAPSSTAPLALTITSFNEVCAARELLSPALLCNVARRSHMARSL